MEKYLTGSYSTLLSMAGSLLLGTSFALLMTGGTALAAESTTNDRIEDALQGDWGQIKMNLRYRFEHVEQDGLKTANGDPIRLRLGYLTPEFGGFQAFAEFEGNTPLFMDDYNSKVNGKNEYAVIADPSEGELNQAWLSLDAIPDTLLKAGRQRIMYDNQRFIGAVGWRQLEQTFDAVTLLNTSIGNFSANAAYIWNVLTITSEDVNMSSPLANLKYTFPDIGSFTGYGYWLDYDDPDNSGSPPYALSTQTIGLRFDGSAPVADNFKLLYTAEYANQVDYQENPEDFSADYYHFIGGLLVPNKDSMLSNISAKIAYEVQGEDEGVSFKTPLGTNHGFSGWADQFLTTPDDGLRDLYGILSTNVAGVKIDLIYHGFQADEGDIDYGTEFDTMLTKKFGKHYTLQAAYANYSADEYKTDTEKFWLQITMSY
jgi:Alginate export